MLPRAFPPLAFAMRIPFLTTLSLAAVAVAQDQAPKPAAVDFATQIWPILESRCVECHRTAFAGPDGKLKKPKGGVTLDTRTGIETSKKRKLVVAGKPADSLLYEAITLPADDEDRMPPEKAKDNTPLPQAQIDLIKQWIEQGASFGTWTGERPKGGKDGKGDEGGKRGDAIEPGAKGKGTAGETPPADVERRAKGKAGEPPPAPRPDSKGNGG